ncbi:RNA cytidine acetyltransferase 1-like protein [Tanacetum coccineum]
MGRKMRVQVRKQSLRCLIGGFGGGDKGDDGCGRRKSAALGLAIAGAGFDMLEYKEHLDYDIVKRSNPEYSTILIAKATTTIRRTKPSIYKRQNAIFSGRLFKKIGLNEAIRYASGDPLELWLNNLLFLDIVNSIPSINRFPPPRECDLYYVNRDTLFSYHKDIELFLQRMMALYVASHYKNSPNDHQLLVDALAHHLFILLDPVNESKNQLPDILCFQDKDFPSLSGARIVLIATHPNPMKLGYGSAAIELLSRTNKWSKLYVFTPCVTEEPPSHIKGEIKDTKKEQVSEEPKHAVPISIVKPTEGLSDPESSKDYEIESFTPLPPLKNLQGAALSSECFRNCVTVSKTEPATPSVPTKVKNTEQESKINELTKLVQMLIDEKVNSTKKTQESNSQIQQIESSKSDDSSKMSQD